MAKIIYITGGQRSGKSSFGQKMAEELSEAPIYLATSRIWDEDFRNRVKRHQSDRSDIWTTIEEEKNIHKHDFTNKVVLLDCITLWLTNFFYDNQPNYNKALEQAKSIWDVFITQNATLIIISNEIGMGMHAETEAGRKFQDIQGWMNQHIAKTADEVYFLVSGIPQKIK